MIKKKIILSLLMVLLGFTIQSVGSYVLVDPAVYVHFVTYDTYLNFNSPARLNGLSLSSTRLSLDGLLVGSTGYVTFVIQPSNVNVTILEAGTTYVIMQINRSLAGDGSFLVLSPAHGQPETVSGALWSYNAGTFTTTLTTLTHPAIVRINWLPSTTLQEGQMKLILFVLGFAMFFGSLGLIAYMRTDLGFKIFLYLVIVILVGFALMVQGGT